MAGQAKYSRRTVNSIFGEVLPEVTADERDQESRADEHMHDEWLKGNIPPHHD